MLDQQPKGDAWLQRDAKTELADNTWRTALLSFMRSLAALHLHPRFVTPSMLPGLRARLLVLPDAVCLSVQDARAIGQFAARGGSVASDARPGTYDAHGKRRAPFGSWRRTIGRHDRGTSFAWRDSDRYIRRAACRASQPSPHPRQQSLSPARTVRRASALAAASATAM